MVSLETKSFGFVGIGAMGKPMVQHLASQLPVRSRISVYDVSKVALDDLCASSPNRFRTVTSAQEVTAHSNVIISMVPEGSHVLDVYLNADTGVCSTDISSKLSIDCSTIDTASSLKVRDAIKYASPSAFFYDAPVSGGVIGAEKGTLAFFLGCAEDDPNYPLISSILQTMGKEPIACGGPSLGLAAKLSNSYLSGLIAIAASEAFDMGMRSGLDPRVLSKVYAAGTGQNTVVDRFNPVPGVNPDAPSTRGYKKGFKVQLMKKDFGLAVQMAERVGTRLVLGESGLRTYEEASENPRCRDLDSRVVYRHLGGKEHWEGRERYYITMFILPSDYEVREIFKSARHIECLMSLEAILQSTVV